MRFGRSTAALLVLLLLLKQAFFGVKAGEWIGMCQLGLVQLGDGGETHCDEGKQLRLVQLGDGGGNSWVMRENLPKV